MEVPTSGTIYDYPPLKSLDCKENTIFIKVRNFTERIVDLIWVNFDGDYVCYETLEGGQYVNITTFTNHVWIAFDHNTRDKMYLNNNFVYEPEAETNRKYLFEYHPNRANAYVEYRMLVGITLPVHTLRFASLLSVKNNFNEINAVDSLELPEDLSKDLKKIINDRNNTKTLQLTVQRPNHVYRYVKMPKPLIEGLINMFKHLDQRL